MLLVPYNLSRFANARLMLVVFTPRWRAISAPERPSSSLQRAAISTLALLTWRRLLPFISSSEFTRRFSLSSRMIS